MRPYHTADRQPLAEVFARAAERDPTYRVLLGDGIAGAMRFLGPRLLDLRERSGARIAVLDRGGHAVGVAIVAPVGCQPGALAYLRHGLLRAPATLGMATTMRLLAADRAVQQLKNLARMAEPHEELLALATDPERGRGGGLKLLRHALGRAPALAVATSDRQVRLYEALGFELAVQNGVSGLFTAFVMRRARQ